MAQQPQQEYVKALIKNTVMERNLELASVSSHSSQYSNDEECPEKKSSQQNSLCLRSPLQTRGRSVKEIEELLNSLKKENFNLKLRIYFLEERMGPSFTMDKENTIKKNIELNVEIESLKKEVQEKHELLCQAVKAMELDEEDNRIKSQEKEEQLGRYHQEIEDLKIQLQEMRAYENDLKSNHSDATNNAYFSAISAQAFNLPDATNVVRDLQDKVQQLEEELAQEKENAAALQLTYEQSGSWKEKCEELQSELETKNAKIDSLNEEIHKFNDKFLKYHEKITELENRYDNLKGTNDTLKSSLLEKNKTIDEVLIQLQDVRKKYANTKVDLDRERKRLERSKMLGDMKVSELEEDNEKYKQKVRELQGRLEEALMDVKKNQNLAVSKSSVGSPGVTNTDGCLFSVQNTAASTGTSKTDTLYVPVALSPSSPTSLSAIPSSPDAFNLHCLDKLLQENGENVSAQLIEQLQSLRNDYAQQKQQIVKLKAEQLKACKIIKTMMDSRNKDIQENRNLKATVEKLEKELESVVCKPHECSFELAPPQRISNVFSPEIEGGDTIKTENTMTETAPDDFELAEHYKILTAQLEEKVQLLMMTMKEKDAHMGVLKERYEELVQELRDRENKIVDLEFELLSSSQQNNTPAKRSLFSEKSDVSTEKTESFFQQQLEEKDKLIEKLSSEVRKRTCDLQQIVNKELWERNRHIEKLENRHTIALENKEKELLSLKSELSEKDLQLKVLTDKISELGIDIDIPKDHIDAVTQMDNAVSFNLDNFKMLQEQLKSALEERNYFQEKLNELQMKVNNSSDDEKIKFIDNLKNEFSCLQKNYEESEKLRYETNEVCSVLSSRLEELAIFLDSLLKQKSVLGFLGTKENDKLRKIIDQSLDLSRTFTMSLLINPDQSLAQLSNLTTLLNMSDADFTPRNSIEGCEEQARFSIVPGNITLTYQSHLYPVKKKDEPNLIIEALRQQIQNLKYELQLRDVELNKLNEKLSERESTDIEDAANQGTGDIHEGGELNKSKLNTSSTVKYQSESEAWSEPDRSVSKARIGLNISSKALSNSGKRSKLTCLSSDTTTEDEDANNTSCSKKLTRNSQTIVDLHKLICELEEKLLTRDNKIITVEENNFELRSLLSTEKTMNSALKQQLLTLDEQFKSIESNVIEIQKQKNEADAAVMHLKRLVEELQLEKTTLENNVEKQNKDVQNRINTLEAERTRLVKTVKESEKTTLFAEQQNEEAKNKLQKMHENMLKLESTLKSNYDEQLKEKLMQAESEAKTEIALLQDCISKLEYECANNCVKKSEFNGTIEELNEATLELNKLKESNQEYQVLIETLHGKELDYKMKLQETQEKINQLRCELDNSTLQYSESVLEKTKIANEKNLIEHELNKLRAKETKLSSTIEELQSELDGAKQNFQKELAVLQNQKSKLEVRISELESSNAELHNRIISLKVSHADQIYSTSLPNNTDLEADIRNIPVNQLYFRRQLSDSQTDYISEEQQIVDAQRERRKVYVYNQQINPNIPAVDIERCEANSSPDLGIESDHGRFSSLEANLNIPRPLLPTLELTESMSNLLDGDNNQVQNINCGNEHCCKRTTDIATENNDLKRKLLRTRRALEETVAQLSLANQRKKQVEKTICKQIHKTSQVLRKAKANLDSGSETDVYKK